MKSKAASRLLITDIDNTLFDWIHYYANCYGAMVKFLAQKFALPDARLIEESAAVFEAHGSTEYPFVIQELPSINALFPDSVDALIAEAVQPARDCFLRAAAQHLQPYPGVPATLQAIRDAGVKIAALTDAPRYVAMWKLNKLGILNCFDAVYGLPDPKIPLSAKGEPLVHPTILMKHLRGWDFDFAGRIRILPDNYEKPDPKGLKTVLMDFGLDGPEVDRHSIVWVGDNPVKDVSMGNALGLTTVWAAYGIEFDLGMKQVIDAFSSPKVRHRNASFGKGLEGGNHPTHAIKDFSEIRAITLGQ